MIDAGTDIVKLLGWILVDDNVMGLLYSPTNKDLPDDHNMW